MSRETDIAWCAGFFDGEGHVSYHRGYPSPVSGIVSAQLYANVPQSADNIEVLEFFHSVIGFGQIKGPYKMPNGKPQFKLQFGVEEVEPLFKILAPYLKREKTEDFQRALMGYLTHDRNPTIEDRVRGLKRKSRVSELI